MKMRSGKKTPFLGGFPPLATALRRCSCLFSELSVPRAFDYNTHRGDARQEIGDVELKCDVACGVYVKRHAP